jgi:hypothetical protein
VSKTEYNITPVSLNTQIFYSSAVPDSISLSGPTKTAYLTGDAFSSAGLVVTAHYSGGTSSVVTGSLTWNGSALVENSTGITAAAGNKTVTVTYQGKTETFNITVTTRVDAATPLISVQPVGVNYKQNNPATALTVSATIDDSGSLSYQWYSNAANSNTDGTPVPSNGTSTSFTPSTAVLGTIYYYVVVTNTNNSVNGTKIVPVPSNTAAIGIKAEYEVGVRGPAGGTIFYDSTIVGPEGWRYLEAAPTDAAVAVVWSTNPTNIPLTSTAVRTGKQNTAYIVATLGPGNYAAGVCDAFEYGGYDDWFLPSYEELVLMHTLRNAIGGFSADNYWSSSQYLYAPNPGLYTNYAWRLYFGSGSVTGQAIKHTTVHPVRAVRAF